MRAKLARQHRPVVVSLAVMRPKIAAEACSRCHKDPHAGQFDVEVKKGDCGGCHTVKSFADMTQFQHDRDSRFPLTGAHRRAACGSCHRSEQVRAGEAPVVVRWKPLPTSCGGCHRDEHQGQFLPSTLPSDGVARGNEGCDLCHGTTTFKETSFRHDNARFTSYALAGKHAKLPCGDCHRVVSLFADGQPVQTVRYRPLPRACERCHVDFHHGDFKGFEAVRAGALVVLAALPLLLGTSALGQIAGPGSRPPGRRAPPRAVKAIGPAIAPPATSNRAGRT